MAENKINFKELKKELKGIEKISKENLDIKSWESEIRLWIKLEEVTDSKTIFTTCLLTSTGEPREVIQDLIDSYITNSESESEDEEEESDSEEKKKDENPSLKEIIEALETFYGLKEDQNILLHELRALRIKRNERVKDFNTRFRSIYLKLDNKRKKSVSVLDYIDALRKNEEAWKRVSLKDDISLTRAFDIAEKVDRVMNLRPSKEYSTEIVNPRINIRNNYQNNRKVVRDNYEVRSPKRNKDYEIEDLTKKMKNLTIKACLYCSDPGHLQYNCPKLNAIIQENKKRLYPILFSNSNLILFTICYILIVSFL